MKTMFVNIRINAVLVMFLALSLSAVAQERHGALSQMPTAQLNSTSSMSMGGYSSSIGSLSAKPVLDSNGSALTPVTIDRKGGPSGTGGPGTPNPWDKKPEQQAPIGSGTLLLLLLAVGYGYIQYRKKELA